MRVTLGHHWRFVGEQLLQGVKVDLSGRCEVGRERDGASREARGVPLPVEPFVGVPVGGEQGEEGGKVGLFRFLSDASARKIQFGLDGGHISIMRVPLQT